MPKTNSDAPKKEASASSERKAAGKQQRGEKTPSVRRTRRGSKGRGRSKADAPKMRVIPLGGLDAIGKNMTAIEFGTDIIVIDCGLGFPDEDMYGIDIVIPDISYLKANAEKVRGIIITHGHEDHIGAVPYVIHDLNVPIYATPLTAALIELKLEEHDLL